MLFRWWSLFSASLVYLYSFIIYANKFFLMIIIFDFDDHLFYFDAWHFVFMNQYIGSLP